MEELLYKPDVNVVRSARYFIRSLCETYGHENGMAVWDKVRDVLGDRAASDIFLGMLTGDYNMLRVTQIGQYKIEAIKLVRSLTGVGLKEAKDFVEDVAAGRPQDIDVTRYKPEDVESFRREMIRFGCVVE